MAHKPGYSSGEVSQLAGPASWSQAEVCSCWPFSALLLADSRQTAFCSSRRNTRNPLELGTTLSAVRPPPLILAPPRPAMFALQIARPKVFLVAAQRRPTVKAVCYASSPAITPANILSFTPLPPHSMEVRLARSVLGGVAVR